ncbi:MAG TPA: DUF2939 domain-containing protein [Caulobacteraceae bacterium]|nr:DUF2939 domain-containing protein [Caulobacteraceae bacterium]
MKRVLPIVLVLAVVVAAGSFVFAPVVAFFALRSAAQAEDVQGLADIVDFDAVRASLKPQLDATPGVQAPPPSILNDPIGAIRRQLETSAKPAPNVDAYLTPDAMEGLTLGEGRAVVRRAPTPVASGPGANGPMPRIAYWGVNRCRLTVDGQAAGETVFTFERRGIFKWKLVHVGLPQTLPAGAPDA